MIYPFNIIKIRSRYHDVLPLRKRYDSFLSIINHVKGTISYCEIVKACETNYGRKTIVINVKVLNGNIARKKINKKWPQNGM